MHCLIIGYGSIGKRHAQILKNLGFEISLVTSQNIEAYRCYATVREALSAHPMDYVVIANPTYLHVNVLMQLIACDYQSVVLVEKPLFSSIDQLPKHHMTILVAYNLRFCEPLLKLQTILQQEELISFSVNVGQYLPTWRKEADYRQCYSAKADQGGGVLKDLSHELDYSLWLCGKSLEVAASGGRYSDLEIDSDDTYSILMRCEKCPNVNLQLNYLDRSPRRDILVHTKNHSIFIDLIKGSFTVDGMLQSQYSDVMTNTYQKQHEAVLTKNYQHFCSYEEGLDVVKLITTIQNANAEKRWITV